MKRLLFAFACLVLFSVAHVPAGLAEPKAYLGAEVFTETGMTYGRVEFRILAPAGPGVVLALFTYKPDSHLPETSWESISYDVLGRDEATVIGTKVVTGQGDHSGAVRDTTTIKLPESAALAYHTYALEWSPEHIRWLMDGKELQRLEGDALPQLTAAHDIHLSLFVADSVDGKTAPYLPVGSPAPSALPRLALVDWIAVYRYDQGAFVLDWRDDFDSLDAKRWKMATWGSVGGLATFSPGNVSVHGGALVMSVTGRVPAVE